jgi:hypothetical protein
MGTGTESPPMARARWITNSTMANDGLMNGTAPGLVAKRCVAVRPPPLMSTMTLSPVNRASACCAGALVTAAVAAR